ncbi:MAG: RNA methyltransferase [Bacteroidota bacterium]
MLEDDLLTYLEGFLTEGRKQRFLDVLAQRTRFLTVAIEDVYQLHNTSAVIRSCDAFGIQDVHVVEDRFGKRLDKNIAMGAEQWVDVHRYDTTSNCIDFLKENGYQIIGTTPHIDSNYLAEFRVDSKTALFFGTEKEGLSEEVIQKADGFLKIPMVGFSESLNISVSAAIIIQELSQQLRNSKMPWKLSPIEILEKRLDWTKKSIKDVEGIISRYLKD